MMQQIRAGQAAKKKKRNLLFLLVLLFAAAAVGSAWFWHCHSAAAENGSIVLGEGQSEVYGKIRDIAGNVVTLSLGTMEEVSAPVMGGRDNAAGAMTDDTADILPEEASGNLSSGGSQNRMPQPDSGDRPAGSMPGGGLSNNMPKEIGSDAFFVGERAESGFSGSMPQGGVRGQRGNDDTDADAAERSGRTERGIRSMPEGTAIRRFTANGEEAIYTIPVSAKVSRGSGESRITANFTMLSAEMTIRMIFQGDLIIAVEVVE